MVSELGLDVSGTKEELLSRIRTYQKWPKLGLIQKRMIDAFNLGSHCLLSKTSRTKAIRSQKIFRVLVVPANTQDCVVFQRSLLVT